MKFGLISSESILIIALMMGCGGGSLVNTETTSRKNTDSKIEQIQTNAAKIAPFFRPMGRPARHDWLASHTEPGQSFAEFLDLSPSKPTAERQTIYAMPLGTFSAEDRKLIQMTVEFLAAFYDLPVKHMKARTLKDPALRPRRNRFTNQTQFKTGDVIEYILKPSIPKDAAALIAFTKEDLYMDQNTNFVFGEASFDSRVGVWSLSRLDDNTDSQNFLLRTLKIAAHETGHMFSMRHCTKYECLMSGTNHLAETDRRPVDTCPECTAKISWLSDVSFDDRYRRLIEFCKKTGLTEIEKEFAAKLKAVEAGKL
jgi:archaemetzincin